MFVTRLSDFSGRDVFAMVSARDRGVIQQRIGGVVGPMALPEPTITNPIRDGLQMPMQNLTVTWNAVPSARYNISLRNLTTGATGPPLIDNQLVNGTSFLINQNLLTAGHQYRVAVSATIGNRTSWSTREFSVEQALTTFTITYANNALNTTGSLPPNENPRYIGLPFNIADNRGNLHRPGFILAGWSTINNLANPEPDFRAGQRGVVINTPGNITLYAHWQSIGWTNHVPVNVNLYYDRFQTDTRDLRNIAQGAALSFDRTFGIRMNISTNIVGLSSAKGDCNSPTMVGPDFLCRTPNCATLVTRNNLPTACLQHHSSAHHMLHDVLFPSSSNQGIHTMYFAGLACHGGRYLCGPVLGLATMRGNKSIVTSSAVQQDCDGNPISDAFWTAIRVTQHEWSHNYGAYDSGFNPFDRNPCETTCIMAAGWYDVRQDVHNVWCNRCRVAILTRRGLH